MRSVPFILTAICALMPLASHAQISTNLPATEIENFELQTDTIIVKGFANIGAVSTQAGVISVRCKESDNIAAGHKMYGIAVAFQAGQNRTYLIADYDELDSLIRALDFLGKISYEATPMPAFDAGLTTRSGLRIAAHSERRQGGIQLSLQFGNIVHVPLAPDQFAQLQSLIIQAKTFLDNDRNKNSSS
jgi:hypothetical protein